MLLTKLKSLNKIFRKREHITTRFPETTKPQNKLPLKALQVLAKQLSTANTPVTQISMSQLHALTCDAYGIDNNDAASIWDWYQQR